MCIVKLENGSWDNYVSLSLYSAHKFQEHHFISANVPGYVFLTPPPPLATPLHPQPCVWRVFHNSQVAIAIYLEAAVWM